MIRRHRQLSAIDSVHFVTCVTSERGRWFVAPSACRGMLVEFETARSTLDVRCLGFVLMPDHFHALLMQTTAGDQLAELMRRFKRSTSQTFRPELYAADTLWRRRYDDVPVPGNEAARTKLHYIHHNPVKRGLAATPESYPWSSAREYHGIGAALVSVDTGMVGMQWL
jgi:putative transposase